MATTSFQTFTKSILLLGALFLSGCWLKPSTAQLYAQQVAPEAKMMRLKIDGTPLAILSGEEKARAYISPAKMQEGFSHVEDLPVFTMTSDLGHTNCVFDPRILSDIKMYRAPLNNGKMFGKEPYFLSHIHHGNKLVLLSNHHLLVDGVFHIADHNVEDIVAKSCRKNHPNTDWANS